MAAAIESLPDDPAALKAIILSQREEITRRAATERALEALVETLKIRIARLRKQKFAASSEKIEREIEQLQLALEDLEVAIAAADVTPAAEPDTSEDAPAPTPRRRGKLRMADTLPRERIVLDPGECCPACGGPLRRLGEDVSAMLDFVAAKLKLVETARLKKVPVLRADRAAGRALAPDPPRHGRAEPARAHPGVEVR